MTAKARQLGMTATIFRNANGLPNNAQHTTARDMATLGIALREHYPQYYDYFSTRSFTYNKRRMGNHNRLLGKIKGVDGIKAGLLKSFGFGQAGAEILLVHPDMLLAALEPDQLEAYTARRTEREVASHCYMQQVMSGTRKFIEVKTRAPYTPEEESAVYLDPLARAGYDQDAGTYTFTAGVINGVAQPNAVDVPAARGCSRPPATP